MKPITKVTTFRALEIGQEFHDEGVTPYAANRYRKVSKTSATHPGCAPFKMMPSTRVVIEDTEAMAKRAAYLARPVFDGTEASCRSREDFYALDQAHDEVIKATEKLDDTAGYVGRLMTTIQQVIRENGAVTLTRTSPSGRGLSLPVTAITRRQIFNSCGEVQGNGNIDMLVGVLLAKREAFVDLVAALGYRLPGDKEEA